MPLMKQIVYIKCPKMSKNVRNDTNSLQNCKLIVKRSLSLGHNSHTTATRGANFEDINLDRSEVAQRGKRAKNGLKTTNKGYSFLRGREQWGNSAYPPNLGAIKRERNGKETRVKRRKNVENTPKPIGALKRRKNDVKTTIITAIKRQTSTKKQQIERGGTPKKTPRIYSTITARDQGSTAYPSPLCLNGKKESTGAPTLNSYFFNFGTYTGSSLQLPSPPGYLSKIDKIVSNKQSSKTSKGKVISLAWSLGPCYTINKVNRVNTII